MYTDLIRFAKPPSQFPKASTMKIYSVLFWQNEDKSSKIYSNCMYSTVNIRYSKFSPPNVRYSNFRAPNVCTANLHLPPPTRTYSEKFLCRNLSHAEQKLCFVLFLKKKNQKWTLMIGSHIFQIAFYQLWLVLKIFFKKSPGHWYAFWTGFFKRLGRRGLSTRKDSGRGGEQLPTDN